MSDDFDEALDDPEEKLAQLKAHHKEISTKIDMLQAQGGNEFEIMTLKRKKLRLKDDISWMMDNYFPDIIA